MKYIVVNNMKNYTRERPIRLKTAASLINDVFHYFLMRSIVAYTCSNYNPPYLQNKKRNKAYKYN